MINQWRILETMDEKKLFQYVKNYFTDIVDLNIENELAPIDWYIPSIFTYVEAKCRYKSLPTYFIQKDKFDELIKVENSWYLNSTPNGVYYWNIQNLDPVWYERYMTNTQQFGEQKFVKKLVADLEIKKAIQIDHLILK